VVLSFDKIESISVKYKSPEERTQDIEKVVNWLRRKGKKDKKYDPTGKFRKIDMLLPKKKNQSLDDRARAIEGAFDYMRHNDISFEDDSVVEKLSKLGAIPISRQTPEQRTKNQQDALNWLRSKGKNDDLIDPTGEFRKLNTMLEMKPSQSHEDRAKDIEMVSDWIRNNAIDVDYCLLDPDDETYFEAKRAHEQRSKDFGDVLNWLRNKGIDDITYDPSGEFRRLDGMLPKKRGQTAEGRARDIEGALDWLRRKDASPKVDEQDVDIDTFSAIPVSRRSIEQRSNDLEKVMNWLRSKGEDDEITDSTGVFRNMDGILPVKRYQSPEDRAHEIERGLD
jgi:hypothetical protein